jgi:acetylserotonin N-methyltransferase
MWDIWMSVHTLPSVRVADESGIFTSLNEEPASIPELAERMGFDRRALTALVRLLAAMGLLAARQGRYHLTELSHVYLRKDSPFYWGPIFSTYSAEKQLLVLKDALTGKGRSGNSGADGRPVPGQSGRHVDSWASGQIGLDEARAVAAIMHSHSLASAVTLARHPAFSTIDRLLDVGGGSGCFSIALAQALPRIACTVMDLPAMCEVAREYIGAGGVGARVEVVPRDMFRDDWPTGYDAMLFANVFHDWNAETCAFLARRAYEGLPKGGRIFLHEMLLNEDGDGPQTTASFSMLMLRTQGQQFSFAELKAILERAGFSDIAVSATSAYYALVTARK